jgi:hypothetical protein
MSEKLNVIQEETTIRLLLSTALNHAQSTGLDMENDPLLKTTDCLTEGIKAIRNGHTDEWNIKWATDLSEEVHFRITLENVEEVSSDLERLVGLDFLERFHPDYMDDIEGLASTPINADVPHVARTSLQTS